MKPPINRRKHEIGTDYSNITDPSMRQALIAQEQNVQELFKRTQVGVSQEEAAFDHQPGNQNQFDKIWRKLRDLENSRGGSGGGSGLNIATVTALPAITGKRIVFLNSATDDVGQTGFWHTWAGADRWYPMSRLTSGDGLEGME